MSNVQSYNALIDRFKAFASGHFILKRFSHGQIEVSDLEKFGEYPFMHVIPSNVTYSQGMKTFSFQIVLADLPRDKEDKTEYQREVLSDLQRIAEDLIAEITNHRVLFGDLITVQNVSLEPFLEEFQHTLTGWTISLDLLVPYYWDACSIPAEWNDMFESSTGGTGSILTFTDSITRDDNGFVRLVNDEAEPSPNYYYGTNDEGVRGWYLLTDEVGLTCVTLPTCQTIIDIEAAIDLLQEDMLLKANTADLGAVAFSNDYNDLDNKPTIPDVSGFVPYTGATTDVDLGTHNLTADHIALNVNPSGAGYVVGATQWNNTIGSSETLLKGGNVSLKNGVDLVARVVNKVTPNTTLTKAAYQAVRISGAQGGRLAVALAQANNDTNSADTIGIVTETIATNQEGFILTVGQLENINTTGSLQGETWVDGDVLYLSPTTAGALTNIKPTGATGHIVVVGYVEYAHANNGSIYVKVMNGWELDELHNVSISSPANNEGLFYDSATSLWKNETITSALGFTPVPETRTLTINGTTQDLSANRTWSVGTFNLPALTSGSVLFSNGTTIAQDNANLFWDDTNNRLGIGTNAPLTTFVVRNSASSYAALIGGQSATPSWVSIGSVDSGNSPFIQGLNNSMAGTAKLCLNPFGSSAVLIGTTTDAGYKLDVQGTARIVGQTTISGAVNASGGLVRGTYFNQTLVATANNDTLYGIDIIPTYTTGAFTGVTLVPLRIRNAANTANAFYVDGNGNATIGASLSVASVYAVNNINLSSGNGNLLLQTNFTGNTGLTMFNATRNVVIQNGGTFTDAGFRLDVVGSDARLNGVRAGRGAGNQSDNTAFGNTALNANTTGLYNTAVGFSALAVNTTSNNNTALGYAALLLTTGASNTAVGVTALQANTTGSNNTAIGSNALTAVSSGSSNIAFGRNSARFIADGTTTLTTSNNSVFIGTDVKANGNSQTNQIVIGFDAIGAGSNTATLGNTSIVDTVLRGRVNIQQYATGSRPTYVKGALIYDSTLGKLVIGGNAGWEVVTSS